MKRQRNTKPFKEQTRSTEVQINEEEIGQLSKKKIVQNNDSKDDQKLWKQHRENARINFFAKT